jgi:MFS family permease
MDKWGRKAGLIYCACFSIVGGALLAGSVNVSMFIVARFFAGMGSWGFLAVSKCFNLHVITVPPLI